MGKKIMSIHFIVIIFVLAVVLLCCSPDSSANNDGNGGINGNTPQETWSARYDASGGEEEMEGLFVAADGGFVIVGNTDGYGDGEGAAWILKLSTSGQVVWAKAYDGPGNESILDIKQTSDGGYIGAGWTTSFGAGGADFWLIKLDESGAIQWQKTYGGAGIEQAWSVSLTKDGGYVIAGGSTSFGAGKADYWVLKLDSSGNIVWQKAFGGAMDDGGGGTYGEYVVRVVANDDGTFVVASDSYSFGHGAADIWIIKLDSGGNIIWQKAYGGIEDDSTWSFRKTVGGGYIIPGVTESVGLDDSGDLWTLKLDEGGNILWQKVYGLKGYWDEALSVGATSDGGALIGGYYEEGNRDWDWTLIRLDSDGNALWQRVYEHSWDWPNAVQQLSSGGFVAIGVAWPNDTGGPEDLWAMKLDANGIVGPSCNIDSPIDLTIKTTNTSPKTTNCKVTTTNITPKTSFATVQDTSTTPNYLCQDKDQGGQ